MSSTSTNPRLWESVVLALLALATMELPACHRRRHDPFEDDESSRRFWDGFADEWDRRAAEDHRSSDNAPQQPKPPMPALPAGTSDDPAPRPVSATTSRVVRGEADLGSASQTGGGAIDASAVARILRGQLGGLRACYERELRAWPTLAGRLDVVITIGLSGLVIAATTGGPLATAAPPVASCVSSRIRGLVFPAPAGGAAALHFPITFSPAS